MRVLHLNNEKTWRGGERQTLLTAQEHRRRGGDDAIACRPGSPLETAARAEGIRAIGLSASAPAALAKLIKLAGEFDLLHCHTGRAHSLAAAATLVRRKPLIVTRRVDFVPGTPGSTISNIAGPTRWFVFRATLRGNCTPGACLPRARS
jgi:L-malate glycosyltransferase